MANNFWNTQISTIKQPTSGKGVSPKKAGPQMDGLNMSTASWPGLPGKPGPDRSAGMPEEKIYAVAQGLRGGVDNDKF